MRIGLRTVQLFCAAMTETSKELFDRQMTRLLSSTDARDWAEAFELAKQYNKWTIDSIDEGLMISWFANAMWRQEEASKYDERRREAKWYGYWLEKEDNGVIIRNKK